MQVSVEHISSVKKTLHIEIPETDVKRELDSAYRDLSRNVKIKGFRPGKAPRKVLERHYEKGVNADVAAKLMEESLGAAIRDNKLIVVGSPEIKQPVIEKGKPLVYDAAVEVRPVLGDIDFKGLSLKKNRYAVQEKEIEIQLKALQRHLVAHVKVEEDRPLEAGDMALIHYEGTKDGEEFALMPRTENFILKIGDGIIHDDLDAAMIGMAPGETRTVDLVFPETHANRGLAGVSVTVAVELVEIRQEQLPEINDDMARKLGRFQTLEELRANIIATLQEGYDKRSDQEVSEQIFSRLLETMSFEVPDAMIEYELDMIIREAEKSFSYHNLPGDKVEELRETVRRDHRKTAEKQVRRQLILGRIIEQEDLKLDEDEMDAGMVEVAKNLQQPLDAIRSHYRTDKEGLAFLEHTLLEKKAVQLIIDSGTVEEVDAEIEIPDAGTPAS